MVTQKIIFVQVNVLIDITNKKEQKIEKMGSL